MKTGIKDSGKRQEFATGSRRDTNAGKLRPDLVPGINRFYDAALLAAGAIKYGENNWTKGQPIMRTFESLDRHLLMWILGDVSENHLAAVRWNAMAIQYTLLMIEHGKLPKELDNRPDYMQPDNEIGKALLAQWEADSKIMLEKKLKSTEDTNKTQKDH